MVLIVLLGLWKVKGKPGVSRREGHGLTMLQDDGLLGELVEGWAWWIRVEMRVERRQCWAHLGWGWGIQTLPQPFPVLSTCCWQQVEIAFVFRSRHFLLLQHRQVCVMKGLGLGPTHAGAVPRRDTFLFHFPLQCPERDAKPQRKNTLVAYSFWNQDSNLGSPLFFWGLLIKFWKTWPWGEPASWEPFLTRSRNGVNTHSRPWGGSQSSHIWSVVWTHRPSGLQAEAQMATRFSSVPRLTGPGHKLGVGGK